MGKTTVQLELDDNGKRVIGALEIQGNIPVRKLIDVFKYALTTVQREYDAALNNLDESEDNRQLYAETLTWSDAMSLNGHDKQS